MPGEIKETVVFSRNQSVKTILIDLIGWPLGVFVVWMQQSCCWIIVVTKSGVGVSLTTTAVFDAREERGHKMVHHKYNRLKNR